VFVNLRELKFVKLQRRWKFLEFCGSVAEVFFGLLLHSIQSVDRRTDMSFVGFE
jgi:hypothetical protein